MAAILTPPLAAAQRQARGEQVRGAGDDGRGRRGAGAVAAGDGTHAPDPRAREASRAPAAGRRDVWQRQHCAQHDWEDQRAQVRSGGDTFLGGTKSLRPCGRRLRVVLFSKASVTEDMMEQIRCLSR